MASVQALMAVKPEVRDVAWLKQALTCAIKLEHATIPPYLCAYWSIKFKGHPFHKLLKEVVLEEMGHMGLAANMLAALGELPPIGDPGFVPSYPGPLPCGIVPRNKPDLVVALRRFSVELVTDVFMNIEYPENDPVPIPLPAPHLRLAGAPVAAPTYHSIGEFYDAIRDAFLGLDPVPTFQADHQLTVSFGGDANHMVFPITSVADAVRAIDLIREQGEGTPGSPDAEDFGMELAHYYKFEQISTGTMYVPIGGGKWEQGAKFPPLTDAQIWPMAEVPAGGYSGPSVPAEVGQFNVAYQAMLANLKLAWAQGGAAGLMTLSNAVTQMDHLEILAVAAMKVPIGAGPETYGPTFQVGPALTP